MMRCMGQRNGYASLGNVLVAMSDLHSLSNGAVEVCTGIFEAFSKATEGWIPISPALLLNMHFELPSHLRKVQVYLEMVLACQQQL